MELSKLVKSQRLKYGLTMKELAQKVGVSEGLVSRWESGHVGSMKTDTAVKVADALYVSPLVFLGQDFLEEKFIEIPIVEKVVAGTPIFAQENIEGMVPVNKDDFKGVMFALKVIGHSMEPHIQEGDLLIIHKQENVDSGDVVIVMINGDMGTCKQIHKSKNGIILTAFNQDAFPPKFFTNQEIEKLSISVVGKVIEIRRKM